MKQIIILFLAIMLVVACNRNKYDYDASGVFEATEIIVSSQAVGEILNLNIEEGSNVEAYTTLGCVDTTQLYLTKMQLESKLKAVNSKSQDIPKQIASTIQQIATQKREQVRVSNLIKGGVANQKQLDDIEAQIAFLEKQLEAQRSSLQNSNLSIDGESLALSYQIEEVDDKLKKSRITSPVKGTILTKYTEPGEVTSIGKPIFKVANLDEMILRAYITSDQLTRVKLNQKVKVFADYKEKERREYEGALIWVSDKAEFTPKTIQTRDERANLVYAIKIEVPNDGMLKIGMYADVIFE
ncbi:HlyD family secretion protein [Dysgonomonadaceae bacterium PH5-43]|nr:HlyD family secretion protein [Dysgonomonadaceae bacterium PH5-43]